MCDADQRLGRHGAHEIKAHPFFRGIDWTHLRQMRAPFIPELRSITDTSHFPMEELKNIPTQFPTPMDLGTMAKQKDLAFIGYTFKRFDHLSRRNAL